MMPVRRLLSAVLALGVIAACHAAPGHGAGDGAEKPRAAAGEWPVTPAGLRARGWVQAYSAGEDSMRAFTLRAMGAESLERRSIGQRLESYRRLFEQTGALHFGSVVKSEPHELHVRLLDADAKSRLFVFRVGTRAPHHLQAVEMHTGSGHGHGGH